VTAASLSTPDGRGRVGAVVIAMATWLCAMLVMALFAWTIEFSAAGGWRTCVGT